MILSLIGLGLLFLICFLGVPLVSRLHLGWWLSLLPLVFPLRPPSLRPLPLIPRARRPRHSLSIRQVWSLVHIFSFIVHCSSNIHPYSLSRRPPLQLPLWTVVALSLFLPNSLK